jgi:diguanylate cyclase (GGDEF)-like protein
MRVMVVEDSPVSRLILLRTVERLGHEIVVARDGIHAWDLFADAAVDVVISDWVMPGLDGLELCRRIRNGDGPYTYFIVLTALADKEHMVTAMEAGADDFLVKPLDHLSLQAGLIAAARVTALHHQLSDQRDQLERLNGLLHDDARRDPLTTVGNRLRLDEDLRLLSARVERYHHGYVAALCDLDFFKGYNDTFGHLAGDEVLKAVAATLVGTARRGDAVYRYGGEEFLVILAEQSERTGYVALERMRLAIEALAIPHPANPPSGVVTISAGLASLTTADKGSVDDWLRRADKALYAAKAGGRNQVAVDTRPAPGEAAGDAVGEAAGEAATAA